MTIYLVEPDAKGRISGGYLYNQRMAALAQGVARVTVEPGDVSACLERLPVTSADCVLADSLFLDQAMFGAFLAVRQRRKCALGVLLHAWPSVIGRASEAGWRGGPELAPSSAELAAMAQLDVVVSPGPLVKRQLEAAGIDVQVYVCGPGAPAARQAPPVSDAAVRILSVGNVTRGKGFHHGAEAVASLSPGSFRWQVVGSSDVDPSWTRELKQQCQRLQIASSVEWLGALAPTAAFECYRTADLFFLPSFTENYPLVLLEAQAHALPTVAYATGGVPDIVVDGETGLLAPLGEVGALRAALEKVVGDVGLRLKLGQAAHKAAAARVNWAEAAQHLSQQLSRWC